MAQKKKSGPGEPGGETEVRDEGFGDLEDLFFAQDAGTFVRDDAPPVPPPASARASQTLAARPEPRPVAPPPVAPPPAVPPPVVESRVKPPPTPVSVAPTPPPPVSKAPSSPPVAAPPGSGVKGASAPPLRTPVVEPTPTVVPESTLIPTSAPVQSVVPATIVSPSVPKAPSSTPVRKGVELLEDEPPVRDDAEAPEVAPTSRKGMPPVEEDPAVRDFFSTGEIPIRKETPSMAVLSPSANADSVGEPPSRVKSPALGGPGLGGTPLGGAATPINTAPLGALPVTAVSSAGGWERVLEHLSLLAEASPKGPERAELLFEASRIESHQRSNWEGAEALARRAVEADPGWTPALRELVRIAAARENWEEAADLLSRQASSLAQGASRAAVLLAAAQIRLAQRDDPAGAEADLNAALEAAPESYIALRFLREIHYRREQWDSLVSVLERTCQSGGPGQAARASYEMGRLFDELMHQPAEAAAPFIACLEAEPLFLPALLTLERIAPAAGKQADLAKRYQAFAEAAGGADGAWAWLRAASIHQGEKGDLAEALKSAEKAHAVDPGLAGETLLDMLLVGGQPLRAAGILRESARGATGEEGASLWVRAGELYLAGGDLEGAASAFTAARGSSVHGGVAREGLRQTARSGGDFLALAEFYAQEAAKCEDLRTRVAYLVKGAEVRAERLGDLEGAVSAYKGALAEASNYPPAGEGLVRCLSGLGRHGEAAEVAERMAQAMEPGESRTAWLLFAGLTYAWRAGDGGRAAACLSGAVDISPGTRLAVSALAEVYRSEGRWDDLYLLLREGSDKAQDPEWRASLLYRAARVAAVHLEDGELAASCHREVLALRPGFLLSILDLRDMALTSGDASGVASLEAQEAQETEALAARAGFLAASARAWRRAGNVEEAVEKIVASRTLHTHGAVSLGMLLPLLRASGRYAALVEVCQGALPGASPQEARVLKVFLAEGLRATGQGEALSQQVPGLFGEDSTLPSVMLGAACESLGRWEAALSAYQAAARNSALSSSLRAAASFQEGLLFEEFREDLNGASEGYRTALHLVPGHSMALEGLERVYTAQRNRGGLTEVYGIQAETAGKEPVRSFYALLAGDFHVELGEPEEAIRYYRMAFQDSVGKERAFEALRRLHVRSRNGGALLELTEEFTADLTPSEAAARYMEVGDHLLQIGDEERAAEVYERVRSQWRSHIASGYHLVQVYPALQRWNSLLGILEDLAERTSVPQVRDSLRSMRDEVLSAQEIDQPEYRPFFERLHGTDPHSPLAIKGLGAIALREKRYDDAELYFTELRDVARTDETRAAASYYLGRLALEKDSDFTRAGALFDEALVAQPSHARALAAIKELHSQRENWGALVAVLSREAASAPEAQRVALYIEIATLWEERLSNPKVAAASWQKVVQQQPGYLPAYDRLLAIFQSSEDWSSWMATAAIREEHLPEEDRPVARFELGRVAESEIRDLEQATSWYEKAVGSNVPNVPALGALRRLARLRGDWERVIDLAGREAAASSDPMEKTALYTERARIRLDHLLDREGAAADFRKAVEINPAEPSAQAFFVDYDFDTERWTSARPMFEAYERTVAQRDVDDEDIREEVTSYYYKFGRVLAALGDEAESIRRFEQALALTPSHIPSLEEIAPRYFARKDWNAAAEAYKTILRLRGGAGDPEQIISLNLQLGLAELEMSKIDSAQKRFKKVLELNPNHVGGLKGIARIYYLREDWNSLLSTYNNIIKYARDPDEVVGAYMTKGDVLDEKLGFPDKAGLHYEKVLSYEKALTDSQKARAMRRLAELAWKRGDAPIAGSWADRAITTSRQPIDRIQSLLLAAVVRGGGSPGKELIDQADRLSRDSGAALEAMVSVKGAGLDPEDIFDAYRSNFPLRSY